MSKKVIAAFLGGVQCMAVVAGVTNVTARQLAPWNLIQVTYEMTENCPGGKFVCTMNDGWVVPMKSFAQKPMFSKGPHSVVWDVERDVWETEYEKYRFPFRGVGTVTVEVADPIREVKPDLYCVIDLENVNRYSQYAVTYLHDVPSGGWTEQYKTSKLVLRRIEPGIIKRGLVSERDPIYVGELTRSYYISVYELTAAQYDFIAQHGRHNVPEGTPIVCDLSEALDEEGRVRVTTDSILGKLNWMSGLRFSLPTEAQWEYAAMAGNGWRHYEKTRSEGEALVRQCEQQSLQPKIVGTGAPNAWGLYDMLDNLPEMCLDTFDEASSLPASGADPIKYVQEVGSYHVVRGGWWLKDGIVVSRTCHDGITSCGVRLVINPEY